MTVAVRCDASPELGMGHLKRCLALSTFLLERGASVSLVFRPSASRVCELAEREGVRPIEMASQCGPAAVWAIDEQLKDAREATTALGKRTPDWFVVDHYSLDATWHASVSALGARVCVIDDLADRTLLADILVDPNLAADHHAKYRSVLQNRPVILGGPRFALLASQYAAGRGYVFREEVTSVGIFMGGGAVAHHCEQAWKATRDAGHMGLIEVAVSSADPGLSDLRRELEGDAQARILADQRDLCAFFGRHDLQIGAGGSAVWERCAMGSPSLLIQIADNQRATLPEVQRLGLADTLTTPSGGSLREAIRALLSNPGRRSEMNRLGPLHVDGRGSERIGLILLSEGFTIRGATRQDAATLLAWRNHPDTRVSSREKAIIPENEHMAWLDRVLRDPGRRLLVGEIAGTPVGIIRFDEVSDGILEVSLYLEPGLHGLGLGGKLLEVGEQALRDTLSIPYSVRAEVLTGNTSSRKLFERGGYSFDGNIGLKTFLGRRAK